MHDGYLGEYKSWAVLGDVSHTLFMGFERGKNRGYTNWPLSWVTVVARHNMAAHLDENGSRVQNCHSVGKKL